MTPLFMIGTLCLIAGYDLLTIQIRGVDSSISRYIRRWGEKWPLFVPLLAFAMGALFGHFFL